MIGENSFISHSFENSYENFWKVSKIDENRWENVKINQIRLLIYYCGQLL